MLRFIIYENKNREESRLLPVKLGALKVETLMYVVHLG